MKKKLTEIDVLLDNIGKTKENIKIVTAAKLEQTGFSSEKNRRMYIDACRRVIIKYMKRLQKLGYSFQKNLAL